MLGDSSTAALGSSSGDAPATAPASGEDDRMKLLSGGGDEFGDRSFGGNRWPRQETIALLKIRSDMDVTFRDASVKGPLWEEVSRKLAELGYQRSAKKCKEKFENVYKYHKRTKEGRTGKADGKTYRFFDQLAALENLPPPTTATFSPPPPPPQPQPVLMASPISVSHQHQHQISATCAPTTTAPPTITNSSSTTVPSIPTTNPVSVVFQSQAAPPPAPAPPNPSTAAALRDITGDLMSNSTSSSSSTDVEDQEMEVEGLRRNKRKRKWKDFFERLMTEVIRRQEDLQKRFLEAIERREQDRLAREESWRLQELSRINRERDILAQERSVAAAKDAAVMSFLQKFSDHSSLNAATTPNIISSSTAAAAAASIPPPPPPPASVPAPPPPIPVPSAAPRITKPPPPPPQPQAAPAPATAMVRAAAEEEEGGGSGAGMGSGSSRWPKTEVHDLIKLRTSLEMKYQENGPKGPLWEEISAAMRRMGYSRSAKRCKEKWENINKYFKKVKESNKRRPEDSKTCPYYNLLDAIYREKMIRSTTATSSASAEINAVPLMVQPEQQWPPLVPPPPPSSSSAAAAAAGDQTAQPNHPSEDDEEDDDDEGLEDEDDEDDEAGNNYELVASTKPNSVGAAET